MSERDRGKEFESRVRLTCAFDAEPREVEWLWAGRVPIGMITMFAGDPVAGWARASSLWPWPPPCRADCRCR